MFIKEIIIDGFKSYPQRTEVKNFDREFNAITGLNGSGKSNILDAICFVLGITNLTQVRVNNLQELIYKNGQAGIIKASVTLVFDNTYKAQSPIGMENMDEIIITRQIVTGGKNKYLLNGYNANNARISDLFRSVNLNVNNPHFLIMQGRITKVLNMKPIEILSLIEETVGTKLYDSKRNAALKIIEKKDLKLDEIHKVINDEIMPLLSKLNEDKKAFLEYQKICQSMDHTEKICKEKIQKYQGQLELDQENFISKKNQVSNIDDQLKILGNEIQNLENNLQKDKGNTIVNLENALKKLQIEQAKCESAHKNQKLVAENEAQELESIGKSLDEETKLKEELLIREKELGPQISVLEKAFDQSEVACKRAQEALQTCSTGILIYQAENTDGEKEDSSIVITLAQRLMQLKAKLADLKNERQQSKMKLQHAQSVYSGELDKTTNISRQKHMKNTGKSMDLLHKEFDADCKLKTTMENTLKNLKADIENHPFSRDPEQQKAHSSKEMELATLETSIDQTRNQLMLKQTNYPYLVFELFMMTETSQAAKQFCGEGKGVYGKIISLIDEVTDASYIRAIEVAAGGKLHNVVVETENIAKAILQSNLLTQRTTFIPLNKINPRILDASVIRKAIEIGGGEENVKPMLDVIKYGKCLDSKPTSKDSMNGRNLLTPAFEFVFGNTLLCKNLEIAKRVAFNPAVRSRCVTLEGDVVEPYGTMSGGYHNPSSFSPLSIALGINTIRVKLHDLELQKHNLTSSFNLSKELQKRLEDLNRLLQQKQREKDTLDFKIKNNPLYQERMELENTKKIIDEESEKLKKCEINITCVTKEINEQENKLKNKDEYHNQQTQKAKQILDEAKIDMEKCKSALMQHRTELEKIQLKISECETNIENLLKQRIDSEEKKKSLQKTLNSKAVELEKLSIKYNEINSELEHEKAVMMANNAELTSKQNEKRTLFKQKGELDLLIQRMERECSILSDNLNHLKETMGKLMRDHKWIEQESIYFGKPNSIYDFSGLTLDAVEKKLGDMKERKNKLSRLANNKALVMLETVEEKYKELMTKKITILNDKRKIEDLIKELDEKKSQAIEKAYLQVNKDFASIFSTLLPGSSATLCLPEGSSTILQAGLEIRVSFNNVWKESLTELSGGQRSLVALSLILSLLLFKPAPIYILDEIDAALDDSHTQNIGLMLSRHFKKSQFIVVSLKDGMFQNANVLYRTQLVDGRSTVTRYTKNN